MFFILVLNNREKQLKNILYALYSWFYKIILSHKFCIMAGESAFCNFKIFQVKTLVPICHRTRRQSFQPHQWHPRGRPWGQTRPQAHPLDRRLDGNGTVRKQGWRQNTSASTVIELNLLRFNPSVCKPRRFNRGSSGPWMQE